MTPIISRAPAGPFLTDLRSPQWPSLHTQLTSINEKIFTTIYKTDNNKKKLKYERESKNS